jgi:hypothetical protein
MNARTKPQAIRLLPVHTAWLRLGIFAAQLAALSVLSYVLIITAAEVATIVARMS